MSIKGALYRPPDIHTGRIPNKELEEICEKVKINLPCGTTVWFNDMDTALRTGGHITEWDILGRRLYSATANSNIHSYVMALVVDQMTRIAKPIGFSKGIHTRTMASCDIYGFLMEDWKWYHGVDGMVKEIAEFEKIKRATVNSQQSRHIIGAIPANSISSYP
jgi:hypothetical protein